MATLPRTKVNEIRHDRDLVTLQSDTNMNRSMLNAHREEEAPLPVIVARRLVKPVHLIHQVHRAAAVPQVFPLAAVPDRENALSNSNSAALLNAQSSSPVDARPQHVHAESAAFGSGTLVDLVERHAVLESTLFHELFAGDVLELVGHAHGEPEGLLDGVLSCGAEFEHVAEAFLRTVFARDAVVFIGDAGVWLAWITKDQI